MYKILLTMVMALCFTAVTAQENTNTNKFRQLRQDLPTPNEYRTASGAPGHKYWQQAADYKMDIEIDDENQKLLGNETITYYNNSPDELRYLWLQLDQNVRAKDSDSHKIGQSGVNRRMTMKQLSDLKPDFDGGFKIEKVTTKGRDMSYTINNTMMRIDLDTPLKPGQNMTFTIKWWYNINNTKEIGGRSGYEPFADGHNVYVIAQYFPRMCRYSDVDGWQNKQFYGRGEFALEFGDYEVNITVPSDHLVSATGTLQNESQVLSKEQMSRLNKAKNEYVQPITIATLDEAEERSKGKGKAKGKKTWKFKADMVRDFAFATSRRFIWDAMNTKLPSGKTAMAMSMWTKEGDCLWSKYSTKAVAHTLKWYSHYTFDYPYPVAWSIDGNMGMEYPMICFNYGRCEDDGTYAKRTKYGHIGVIIHEVGHNWFPMIVNSDERQWTWMDEGLNTYVQYLTEQQWERNYPHGRGPAENIVNYMKGDKSNISPIMTNSESIHQFGSNAYGKPATALNILRETILGRELMDHAFREYSRRWAFKSPTPADLFRTLEDASGTDLDWFWRGWFYTNDHVDLAMTGVKHFKADPKDPNKRLEMVKAQRAKQPTPIAQIRNKKEIKQTYSEIDPTIIDFYSTYDPAQPNSLDFKEYNDAMSKLSPEEKALMQKSMNYYELTFENKGGLPMPIILEFTYADGTTEVERIPAEIWRFDDATVSKVFPKAKEVTKIVLDPFLETADTDRSDNYYPQQPASASRFDVFKRRQLPRGSTGRQNAMQRAKKAKTIKP